MHPFQHYTPPPPACGHKLCPDHAHSLFFLGRTLKSRVYMPYYKMQTVVSLTKKASWLGKKVTIYSSRLGSVPRVGMKVILLPHRGRSIEPLKDSKLTRHTMVALSPALQCCKQKHGRAWQCTMAHSIFSPSHYQLLTWQN